MSINVQTCVNQLGYGHVGLNLLLALERIGCEPAWWPLGAVEAPTRRHDVLRGMQARTGSYSLTAPSLRIYHQFELAQHIGKGVHSALPIFELDRFTPRESHHMKQQDVVFVASDWANRVLLENGIAADRVVAVPFGVDTSIFKPVQPTKKDGPTVFLNVGKWELRKGHDLLIEAFNCAFLEQDNVELWMLSHNPVVPRHLEKYNHEWARLYMESRMGKVGKVKLIPRVESQEQVAELMARADCGVFPSRAEGWGMGSAEMLAMGKDVILTDYSAHTQYADGDNSMLISVDEQEEAHDGVWFDATAPHWGGKPGRWARLGESQREQLVCHLRQVHRTRQGAGCLPFNQSGVDTFKCFTWDNAARTIRNALEVR